MSRLRVLLVGEDSPGNGGWCYAAALRRRGHEVVHLSDWLGLGQYRSGLAWRAYRRATRRVWEPHRREHLRRVFAAADRLRPDLLVALGGLHFGPADVRRFQAAGAWMVNLNHDDFFSQYRLNHSAVQRAAIPVYDYVLTTREVNVGEIHPLNPRVEFFPFAYDPAVHRPVPIPPAEANRWKVDVSFVGTYAPHRAAVLERLVQAAPARYAVYGASWEKLGRRSPLRPHMRFGNIFNDDLAKAIGGAEVSLGFLRRENRDDYTQRTFEIPACGGLMLMERTARQQALYRDGEEAVFFDPDDPADLAAKVRELLADPARRGRIRAAGAAAVTRLKATYDDRIDRLLALYWAARPPAPMEYPCPT